MLDWALGPLGAGPVPQCGCDLWIVSAGGRLALGSVRRQIFKPTEAFR